MVKQMAYRWARLDGRIFLDGEEKAALIREDERVIELAGWMSPEYLCVVMQMVLDQLADEQVEEPVIVVASGGRRKLPPGWKMFSGCYSVRPLRVV